MGWSKDTTPEWAADYRKSFLSDLIGEYTDRSERRPVLESMRLRNGSMVLDAGCGTGRYLKSLPAEVNFVGLDLSREMLKISRDEAKRGNFVVGLADVMPFPDNTFDELISVRVLQHVRNQAGCIHEMARVLKPGGRLVILALNTWTLHSLYKNMRMGWQQKLFDLPFGWILRGKSPFRPWTHPYDNYSSMPELTRQCKSAGLRIMERKGGTLGSPWLFNYFHVHAPLGKAAPSLLSRHFAWCERQEPKLESGFLKYFMDKVIVVADKP